MSESYTLYEEAQIFLSAIRLFKHWEKRIPSMDELTDFTRFSKEAVHHLCNRMEKIGAVERIRGTFDDRICLKDPLQVETLRKEADAPKIDEDIRKVEEQRENTIQDVEKRFSSDYGKAEKDDLFSKLEETIRKGGKEEKKNPLDDLFKKNL